MKRFIIVILFFLFFCSTSWANQVYTLNYGGETYNLIFSEKSNEHNGFYNQYLKQNEDASTWTELIVIHHFPNVYSPIEQAHNLKEYVEQLRFPGYLTEDTRNNSAMIDFLFVNTQNSPMELHFNVFKCVKASNCGTLAVQYIRKYSVSGVDEVMDIKKKFAKTRLKSIKLLKEFEIPPIVEESIGEIKLNDLP